VREEENQPEETKTTLNLSQLKCHAQKIKCNLTSKGPCNDQNINTDIKNGDDHDNHSNSNMIEPSALGLNKK